VAAKPLADRKPFEVVPLNEKVAFVITLVKDGKMAYLEHVD
jgi:hypothetical protein